jgi:hypothetical protein
VEIKLAAGAGGPAGPDLVPIAEAVAGVGGAEARNGTLTVSLTDDHATPGLVRALVGAGAAIDEVRRQAATLEDVYFEVMGVRPGADERDRAGTAAGGR